MKRATLRGAERTPLDEQVDVLICGASFAGLAAARPAIAAAPPSVRPGVRLAVALYDRMLRTDRPTGVRIWHLPGAALEALR